MYYRGMRLHVFGGLAACTHQNDDDGKDNNSLENLKKNHNIPGCSQENPGYSQAGCDQIDKKNGLRLSQSQRNQAVVKMVLSRVFDPLLEIFHTSSVYSG